MSSIITDDDNDKLRRKPNRNPNLKVTLSNSFKRFQIRLQSKDKTTIIKLVVSIITVLFILSSFFTSSNNYESDDNGSVRRKNRDFFEGGGVGPSTVGSKYHEYINSKLTSNHENVGFGRSDHLMKHKPGFPPSPNYPGIFAVNNNDDGISTNHQIKPLNINKKKRPLFFKNWFNKQKRKIYMIVGKSTNVGIKHQKSKESWLTEKLSILNKMHYSEQHDYELIVLNSMNDKLGLQQKRYQHEFREGWEKFDSIRKVMKQTSFNNEDLVDDRIEEWFWYVDIHTLIMEPDLSLEEIVFKNLDIMYRDLNYFNPNNLAIDEELGHLTIGSSLKETNNLNSIDLILSQDCNGINLNSFLIKKSSWSNLLLDTIWDPVLYKQMHVEWVKNKNEKRYQFRLSTDEYDSSAYSNDIEEKNCLEYLFNTQSWIRSRVGFMPIRTFNSLSKDFCNKENEDEDDEYEFLDDIEENNKQKSSTRHKGGFLGWNSKSTRDYLSKEGNFHYQAEDRDFLINYMNCERHGNCYDRFLEYSDVYEELHKSWIRKLFFFL